MGNGRANTWQIAVGSDETTAAFDPADPGTTVFVCAHGAGGHMDDRSILAVTRAIRAYGIATVRFNFLYRANRAGRPDPMPRLIACWRAVVERVRTELHPKTLLLGGRSMGGRAASVLVADGEPCDGLLLLAYPLHPPGQPGKLRIEHLPAIQVPVLCFNGTRDPFCDPALMKKALTGLGSNWHMHWLDGADHSFHVLKRSGRTDADVLDEVGRAVGEWVKRT